MKIALLTVESRSYSSKRLKEAAESRGHKLRMLDTRRFSIELEAGEPDLTYKGKSLAHYDAIIPRIGASITYFGTALVRQFEQMEVYTPNSAAGIVNSRDKLRSLQILSRHDIGIPETIFVRNREDVLPAIERIGGAPVIIKLLEGTQGIGVILAETEKMAESVVETLHSAKQNVLIQKFIRESRGSDVRALVVGDRVVAAMRRRAREGEFRSNLHRGGSSESVVLSDEYAEAAIRSAQIMGLRIAGVDILESHEGPKVMEVNSSPGLEGIEKSTQLDVAGTIIEFLEDQVDFPELDIRQKLTVSTSYGVAEIVLPKGSEFTGKTIADSGLEERDISVLTLRRGSTVVSNPRTARTLEEGDRLLCYGRLESMRDLVPVRRLRKKKRVLKKLETLVRSGETSPQASAQSVERNSDEAKGFLD